MTDIDTTTQRVAELIALYGDPDACAANLLCDRHDASATAFTFVADDLDERVLTYGELRRTSERLASAFAELGVGAGDRVATLMGKSADLVITLLAIWRLGAVHVPVFTAFAPQGIAVRLLGSHAKVVVCDRSQRPKLEGGEDIPTHAPWRIVVAHRGEAADGGDLDLRGLIDAHEPGIAAAALGGGAPLVHIYTSGTTGGPKGVVVPIGAIACMRTYMEFGLDVTSDHVYWCTADPGWAYGLYYAIIGPLAMGVPSLLLEPGFSPELTWSVLAHYGVTNFAAAPTVYRALRASGAEPPSGLALRCASSAGEPLTPEVNEWAADVLGLAVHDHYGQTEAGMLVNNHHAPALRRPLKPGSMGRPMPGWAVHVLDRDRDEIAQPGEPGRIAVDMTASPLAWFHGYHEGTERSAERFSADGRWYLTGDTGVTDDDGDFHFTSRDDDIIIMAGYRIGPFEVESVLASHPDVVESAAIAVPDGVRGEVLEAHVVLRDVGAGTPELATELQRLVKTKLAAHAYPRAIHFVEQLPRTPSGKIQRFVLRQRASRTAVRPQLIDVPRK
jgi:acetyl-CoA synthetase